MVVARALSLVTQRPDDRQMMGLLGQKRQMFAQAHAGLAAVYLKLGREADARRERDIAAGLAAQEH